MSLFHRHAHTTTTSRSNRGPSRFSRFTRKDPDRVAGGYKAALSNPNTTRNGRQHAKHELRLMGRNKETHVPIMTRIRRALGIRSTPKKKRSTFGGGGALSHGGSTRRRRAHRF